jgi:hypothetical protein
MPAKGERINKADLAELIDLGFKSGFGPRYLTQLTGYSRAMIMRYAKDLGLKSPPVKRKTAPKPTYEFLICLQKVGLTTRRPS